MKANNELTNFFVTPRNSSGKSEIVFRDWSHGITSTGQFGNTFGYAEVTIIWYLVTGVDIYNDCFKIEGLDNK